MRGGTASLIRSARETSVTENDGPKQGDPNIFLELLVSETDENRDEDAPEISIRPANASDVQLSDYISGHEARAHRRVYFKGQIIVHFPSLGTSMKAVALDLSEEGLAISGAHPTEIAVGQEAIVEFAQRGALQGTSLKVVVARIGAPDSSGAHVIGRRFAAVGKLAQAKVATTIAQLKQAAERLD